MDKPEILAPAGDTDSFLAALAAGADGIYLGLKNFSARMAAQNFGLADLTRLIDLAHRNGCRVYVAMNNMIKPEELKQVFRLVWRLGRQVHPDGLIIQDLGLVEIARQTGFGGSIAFSTLANVTNPLGLKAARELGVHRVILPRELSVDEIRIMGEGCPPGLELECFVHGALCYCVSGRCYWSSYMGGRSGLRGRCTQPCRRKYARLGFRPGNRVTPKSGQRLFSCQDLELAPAIRALLNIPNIASWKIEGRKKGPHYVYHTVTAYKILRDYAEDSQQRKFALELLELALGRPGVRARFLPQKLNQPMAPFGQTGSGLLAGKVKIQPDGSPIIRPHFELLPKDLLRIGAEDEHWHTTLPVKRAVPKGGTLLLNQPRHKTPAAGIPVFLIDRKTPDLQRILGHWRQELERLPLPQIADAQATIKLPVRCEPRKAIPDMLVMEEPKPGKPFFPKEMGKNGCIGVWLAPRNGNLNHTLLERLIFWLPPAIWPEHEGRYQKCIGQILQKGGKKFVCNAPWQRAFFPEKLEGFQLIAGPFCNAANALALEALKDMGFMAAFISPELPKDDIMKLPAHSPIPLGMIIKGYWPVGLSRFGLMGIGAGEPFQGIGGEIFWTLDRRDMTWIFPSWPLDLLSRKDELHKWGYEFFAWLEERPPKEMPIRSRPGLFNWDGQLL